MRGLVFAILGLLILASNASASHFETELQNSNKRSKHNELEGRVNFNPVPSVTGPDVEVHRTSLEVDQTESRLLSFDVYFEVPVTGFDLSDIQSVGEVSIRPEVIVDMGEGNPGSENLSFRVEVYVLEANAEGSVEIHIPGGSAISMYNGAANSASTCKGFCSYSYAPIGPTVFVARLDPYEGTDFRLLTLTVDFSEPVEGFELSDIEYIGEVPADLVGIVDVNAGGDPALENKIFEVQIYVTDANVSGTVAIQIPSSVSTALSDGQNNQASYCHPGGCSYYYDPLGPTVFVARLDPDDTDSRLLTLLVDFSEPVEGFELSDIEYIGEVPADLVGIVDVNAGDPSMANKIFEVQIYVTDANASGTVAIQIPDSVSTALSDGQNNQASYCHPGGCSYNYAP